MKRTTTTSGFTLIELLVVIAIISLLAGLLFPAIGSALQSAERSKASVGAKSIESAIMLYSNDYNGKLPVETQFATEDTLFQGEAAKKILAVLMALNVAPNDNHKLNPKQKVYLSTERATDDGTYLDPWGTQYAIKLDTNHDGRIEYLNADGEDHRKKVVVISAGQDTDLNATDDNIANVLLNN